ncbi:MAG: hypothetical protein MHM6MM_003742 [Cercozoa sp. M6MM]
MLWPTITGSFLRGLSLKKMTQIRATPMCSGENEFANVTMRVRIPNNVRMCANGMQRPYRDAILSLAQEIERNEMLPPPALDDSNNWRKEFELRGQGKRWQSMEWMFAECYAYRLILERAKYHKHGIDPSAHVKREALMHASTLHLLTSVTLAISTLKDEALEHKDERLALKLALHASLWGNKADLCFLSEQERPAFEGDLVCDHTDAVIDYLHNKTGTVVFICDNAGAEFMCDMVLACVLLRTGCTRVIMCLKEEPTFISDTTKQDADLVVSKCRDWAPAFFPNELLEKIEFQSDLFWDSPQFFDCIPSHIVQSWQGAHTIISKGDLNYRKWMRDSTEYDASTPLELVAQTQALAVLSPMQLVLLRTLKSDVLAGISQEVIDSHNAQTGTNAQGIGEWRHDGARALVQQIALE